MNVYTSVTTILNKRQIFQLNYQPPHHQLHIICGSQKTVLQAVRCGIKYLYQMSHLSGPTLKSFAEKISLYVVLGFIISLVFIRFLDLTDFNVFLLTIAINIHCLVGVSKVLKSVRW